MSLALLANDESASRFEIAMLKLLDKCPALDAVEKGIRAVEADTTVDSVGAGGFPNMLGEVECDAAIMCGQTLRTGVVGALRNYIHAISVARQVMERLLDMMKHSVDAQNMRGTSVFLLRDRDGHMAGGTSSSGWTYKYPGRIGDSAVIGAGLYMDERCGGAACTHTGEMTIRAGTARAVVAHMRRGGRRSRKPVTRQWMISRPWRADIWPPWPFMPWTGTAGRMS